VSATQEIKLDTPVEADPEPRGSPTGEIDIRILDRLEAVAIDSVAWDRLADNARVPNPFYERWHLVPALKYLDKNEKIFVVTGYDAGRLVCLFPVCLKRIGVFFLYLKLWAFCDCLMSDVLYIQGVPLDSVFRRVMDRLRVHMIVSPKHRNEGFDIANGCNFSQSRLSRKGVSMPRTWDEYLRELPRKHRKENKRIMTRLLEKEGAHYVSSEDELVAKWLPRYMETEKRSWKAKRGSVISSDSDRTNYFAEAIGAGEGGKKVEFQSVVKDDVVFAMSFRFKAQDNAYEIKTVYDEAYKNYNPGVVLELLNIRGALEKGFTLVDSCAFENKVADRLWPDVIHLYRTRVFRKTLAGEVARALYVTYRNVLVRLKKAQNLLGDWYS